MGRADDPVLERYHMLLVPR
ncbi:hypothetical protein ID866_7465 [Astraeus odoratus]|nr:hypothetical protein ID866_7465 [Astraeus odoratus]